VADAEQVKAALVDTVLPAVWVNEGVQILYGGRPAFLSRDVCRVGDVTTEVTHPTLGRVTERSQHERHAVTLTISCGRLGPVEVQRVCTERAFALYRLLATYLLSTTTSNATLGLGARTDTRLTGYELVETDEVDEPEVAAKGRNATLTVSLDVDSRR
jgi:hypothetical protein